MEIIETGIPHLFVIQPRVFEDARGYFFETYNLNTFVQKKIPANFIQDNESLSSYGVVRGLHYQIGAFSQAKLVRVIQGRVLDVAVDLRKGSPTYLQHYSVELSAKNKKQLFVPRGFAHGFSVLEPNTIFSYKCDNYYNKTSERGINLNDESLGIDWQIPKEKQIVSEKDVNLPELKDADFHFIYPL